MRYQLLSILFACALAVFANPAKRTPFTITLEDGSTVTVTLCGDENYHYLSTLDGVPVIEASEGIYRLAPEMKDSISIKWAERLQARNAHRQARARKVADTNRQRKALGLSTHYTGKKKGIVILVNFADVSMKKSNTTSKFNDLFNLVGYNKNGHIGSVHDYFKEVSYGEFDLEFDIYGPVKLSRNMSYYGKNDSNGSDMYVGKMAAEACRLAHKENSINWSKYDWDGDGYVDQVYIIYAGYGESSGAPAETIWPHEFSLTGAAYKLDGTGPISLNGTKVDTYAMSCELAGTSGVTMNGIGAACHEFSHCLGIPDFYDTSHSGGYGMNGWDLMASGDYSGPCSNGEAPVGYTAYERWFAGWLEPIRIDHSTSITDMPALCDEPVAYILYNDNNFNEFYLIENRQSKKFHTYVHDRTNIHGLLISHVDYNMTLWTENKINNEPYHQRMTIIPAGKNLGEYIGGRYYSTTVFDSQLFPGSMNVTELNNESHYSCNGKLFSKNTDGTYYMNKTITNIRESNGLISFDVNVKGEPAAVASVSSTDEDAEYFTLNGTKVTTPTQRGIYLVKKAGKVQKMLIGR